MLPAACPRRMRAEHEDADATPAPDSPHAPVPPLAPCRPAASLEGQSMEGSGAGPRAATVGGTEEDANARLGEQASQPPSLWDSTEAIRATAALAGRDVSFQS
eukprot:4032067-Heterocapsa_arctica.AAC.1